MGVISSSFSREARGCSYTDALMIFMTPLIFHSFSDCPMKSAWYSDSADDVNVAMRSSFTVQFL